MKTFSQSIKQVAVVSGLFLGAFTISVLAADVWTAAPQSPPNGNTPAPINVGSSAQAKVGPFAVGQGTVAESGLDFQVAKVAKLGALLVSGDVTVPSGKTYTNKIQIGDVDPNSVNHVLTKTDAAGNAEWKPNTSGLSGASRIYCAAGSSGDGNSYSDTNNYFKIKSPQRLYEIVKKIEGKGSPRDFDLGGKIININYLDGASPSNPTQGIVAVTFKGASVSTPPSVSCPAGKELIFHSMIGSAKDEEDDNNMQIVAGVVTGDYVANSISCVSQPNDRPTFIAGVGLCI